MISSNTYTLNVRAKLCALLVVLLFAAGGAATWAQHQGHDMQNMPGMNMSKAKARPRVRRKVRAKARPTTRRKRRARRAPKKHDMQGMNMNGMDMRGMHMPVK